MATLNFQTADTSMAINRAMFAKSQLSGYGSIIALSSDGISRVIFLILYFWEVRYKSLEVNYQCVLVTNLQSYCLKPLRLRNYDEFVKSINAPSKMSGNVIKRPTISNALQDNKAHDHCDENKLSDFAEVQHTLGWDRTTWCGVQTANYTC